MLVRWILGSAVNGVMIETNKVQRCFVQRMFPEDAVNRELRKIGIREFRFEWPVRLLTSQDPHSRKRTAFWSNLL